MEGTQEINSGASPSSSKDYFASRPPPRPLVLNTNFRPKLATKYSSKNRSASVSGDPFGTWSNGVSSSSRHGHTASLGGQRTPRIGRLLGAVLNGPSSNTNNPNDIVLVDGAFAEVPTSQTVTRPPSPAPTADYSMVSPPSPMSFVHVRVPSGAYDVITSPTSGPEGTPACAYFISPAKAGANNHWPPRRTPTRLGKATLGRIWGALSSPARKGKGRAFPMFDLPLDGEEGELIDEACFFEPRTTVGCGKPILSFLKFKRDCVFTHSQISLADSHQRLL